MNWAEFLNAEMFPYSELFWSAFSHIRTQYSVPLRIQSECGKIRRKITANTDTFYIVGTTFLNCLERIILEQMTLESCRVYTMMNGSRWRQHPNISIFAFAEDFGGFPLLNSYLIKLTKTATCSIKKAVRKNFSIFTRKPVWKFHLNKVARRKNCNFIKKMLQHRCLDTSACIFI